MRLDPARRHQIEQDAIALLRQIADLERDVILGADANGHHDLISRITTFLVKYR